jgi:hypothetical protein
MTAEIGLLIPLLMKEPDLLHILSITLIWDIITLSISFLGMEMRMEKSMLLAPLTGKLTS